MAVMHGASAVVEQLVAEGVEVAFGIPAVQSQRQYDALYFVQDKLRHVVARNELSAAYMADGYARTSGKPAALFVVGGPGLTNALTGIGEAWAASSPMIVISNVVERQALNMGHQLGHEIHNQIQVAAPVTAWSKIVYVVGDIPASINEAMRRLKTARPRPVELEIPFDVGEQNADLEILPPADANPLAAADGEVARVLDELERARKVVIIAGGGVLRAGAWAELTRFAELLGATVLTTQSGRGAMADDNPLSVGALWMGLSSTPKLIDRADLVVAVGTRLASFYGVQPKRVVHIDIDEAEIKSAGVAAAWAVGDARAVLGQLLQRKSTKSGSAADDWGAPHRAEIRREAAALARSAGPIASEVLRQVRAAIPDDAILTTDSLIGLWANRFFEVRRPRGLHNPLGFGSLGFALPAGIGAYVGGGGAPVVALGGDGAFMYTCGELATAVQENARVCSVILNDHGYEAIRVRQRRDFDSRFIASDLVTPDYVKLAESFGLPAARVHAVGDLGGALAELIKHPGPSLIEVMTGCEPPPPFRRTPLRLQDGGKP